MNSELTDAQWALIQPHLPPAKKRGRPRAQDRRTINGILYVQWHSVRAAHRLPLAGLAF
jgi:transposase